MAGSLDAGDSKQIQENSKICWGVAKKAGFSDQATAGILGNIYAESMFNANAHETPSPSSGYGLAQWTPGTKIYGQGAQVGVSRAECETVEGQMKIIINGDKVGQWMNTVASGANTSSLGYPPTEALTINNYKSSKDVKQACVDWENHYERGLVGPTLRITLRIHAAEYFYDKYKGTGGGGDGGANGTSSKGKTIIMDNWIKRREYYGI